MNIYFEEFKMPDFDGILGELEAATARAAKIISTYSADDCAEELEHAPRRVDTGNLKNSIDGQVVDNNTVVVGTNVNYAIYVHQGTQKMAANRFLRNGLSNNREEYAEIWEKCLKG